MKKLLFLVLAMVSLSANAQVETPTADLLDVVFNPDGSAYDASAKNNEVTARVNSGNVALGSYITHEIPVAYNSDYNRHIATMESGNWACGHGISGVKFYQVKYGNDADFMSKLSDGHTIEVLIRPSYSHTLANDGAQADIVTSFEAGGTGLQVHGDKLAFTIKTGDTYKFVDSDVTPLPGVWYHVVGVYDIDMGSASIFVDGVFNAELEASGPFGLPKEAARWFGIGADPGSDNQAQNSFRGDIAMVRIYDKALADDEVAAIYDNVKNTEANLPISNVSLFHDIIVKQGGNYHVKGTGFQSGDKLTLTSTQTGEDVVTDDINIKSDNLVSIPVPTDLASGTYNVTVHRDGVSRLLGTAKFTTANNTPKGSLPVVHRGYSSLGEGTSTNSRQSLRNAISMDFYTSEFDVYITADGEHLVINHDPTYNGVNIETADWATISALTLSNGETLPELKDFLEIRKNEYPESNTRLTIEIKPHSGAGQAELCAEKCVEAVSAAGLQDMVEYISFDYNAIMKVLAIEPTATVGYGAYDGYVPNENCGVKAPADLAAAGVKVCNFSKDFWNNHTSFLSEALENGMMANIWTLNSQADIISANNAGFTTITTDNPELAQIIYDIYSSEYEEGVVEEIVLSADMLDVVFNLDGTAYDASPSGKKVEGRINSGDSSKGSYTTTDIPVSYNSDYTRNVATFNSSASWGNAGRPEGVKFYQIKYEDDINFMNKLSDGHTLEALIRCNYTHTLSADGTQSNFFTSFHGGGTGLQVHGDKIAFTLKTGSSYKFVDSSVTPLSGVWYHVVGVYDKEAAAAKIYINGVYNTELEATGDFALPSSTTARWFCIAGDADVDNQSQNNWKGDVALIRVYDKVLTDDEVKTVYNRAHDVTKVIGEEQFSSLYYGERNLIVPSGLEANTYKVEDEKLVCTNSYQEGEVIPAGEAVVLHAATPGTYCLEYTETTASRDEQNALYGFDVTTEQTADADTYYYAVSFNEEKEAQSAGYYWMNESGTAFTANAHEAYLNVNKSAFTSDAAAKVLYFNYIANAIESAEVAPAKASESIFNLQGMRVKNINGKGIYIKNGKKVVVR